MTNRYKDSKIYLMIPSSKPSIHQTIRTDGAIMLSSSNNVGNQWFFNDALVDSTTDIIAKSTGKYAVQINSDSCVSERSDEIDIVIAGLDEFNDQRVNIYPNPVRTLAYVDMGIAKSGDETTIIVYDCNGRTLETFNTDKQTFIIPFEAFNPGIYIVAIMKDGNVLRKRVAKI